MCLRMYASKREWKKSNIDRFFFYLSILNIHENHIAASPINNFTVNSQTIERKVDDKSEYCTGKSELNERSTCLQVNYLWSYREKNVVELKHAWHNVP